VPITELPPAITPQPGDVWHDTMPSFTGGTYWHARDNGKGGVELYEPNGPGLIPASEVSKMRGGMTLVSRGIRTLPDASRRWPCWRIAGAVTRERNRGWPGVGPAWTYLCSDIVRDRPATATRPSVSNGGAPC
jgi:hypothetical protein